MINGKSQEFLDHVYSGQDTPYRYAGEKYWCQGYNVPEGFHLEIVRYSPTDDDVWEYSGEDPAACLKAFLAAPIFKGKTFWEVEQEVEWLDE